MVDEIPKLTPELFTTGSVEHVKAVRPKPEEGRDGSSEFEGEGLEAQKRKLVEKKREQKPRSDKPKDRVEKKVITEDDDGLEHVDVVV